MVVGIARIELHLHGCHSLKAKRRIVKSVVSRVRNTFNASVAEVALNDVHTRAVIGIAMTGNDRTVINSKLDKSVNLVEDLGLAEMTDVTLEIFNA
jgi:uncharacterized protein YlxP (DUF503 family)